jgi:HlyD family secretion protein
VKKRLLYLSSTIAVLILILVISINAFSDEKEILTAVVETAEIDVSAKIPGRIESIYVREGDVVQKGQILALLGSAEIDAKVEQARGAMNAAKANYEMAQNGARPEELDAVEKLYRQTLHQFEYAEKTYNRIENVFKDSVISVQQRDEAQFKYDAAREQMEAAKAKYDLVKQGARPEKIRAAAGIYHQAKNALIEAESYQSETKMASPIDGLVQSTAVDAGEMISAGYPVITLVKNSDVWLVLHIREDQLRNIQIDDNKNFVLPALGEERYTFKVSHISPMADFATWRATNQKGEFDLKTFEIHLRPVEQIKNIRAGMTARVEL